MSSMNGTGLDFFLSFSCCKGKKCVVLLYYRKLNGGQDYVKQ